MIRQGQQRALGSARTIVSMRPRCSLWKRRDTAPDVNERRTSNIWSMGAAPTVDDRRATSAPNVRTHRAQEPWFVLTVRDPHLPKGSLHRNGLGMPRTHHDRKVPQRLPHRPRRRCATPPGTPVPERAPTRSIKRNTRLERRVFVPRDLRTTSVVRCQPRDRRWTAPSRPLHAGRSISDRDGGCRRKAFPSTYHRPSPPTSPAGISS